MLTIRDANGNLIEAAFAKLDMAARGLLAMQPGNTPQFEITVSGGRLSVSGLAGADIVAAKRYLQMAGEQASENNRLIKAINIEPQFPIFHVTP